jgi:alkylation response protein AidB-like acyl-CoA dehydrogenase
VTTTTGPTGTTVPRLARASRPVATSDVGETPADPAAGRTSADPAEGQAPAGVAVDASAGGSGPAGVAAVAVGEGEGAVLREGVARVLGGAGGVAAMEAVRAARERGEEPDPRPLYRLLGAERLLAASWPRAYGGLGAPPLAAAGVVEALITAGVPDTLHTLSVQISGNFLLRAGTHAQRATVLPALAAGTRFCTVLYSEPDVGSDLAALTTRAEPTGEGGWRLTGRKVYSVKTRYADLGLVAARTADTASRYQGITLFLVPLDAPGVTVGALPSIADEDFADVRLSGVDVPAGAVVGPVGGAWPLITEALALERTGVDYVAKSRTWLTTWFHQQPIAAPTDRSGPADRVGPAWRAVEAGRLVVRTEAARALAGRCLAALGAGTLDPVQAAATKLWCSETAAAVAWWTTEQAGPAGATGRLESAYREAPGLTLSAGTSEMMLELVAGSGLPAPDSDPAGTDEPLARQLRAAVRSIATAYDDRDPHTAWWSDLATLGLFRLALPADRGGLPLGTAALTLACEELGRELHDAHLLDTLTTLDALTTNAGGGAVPSAAIAGGWRAAVVTPDHTGPSDVDAWLVVRWEDDGPVLSLGAPGRPVDAAAELCRGRVAERVLTAGRLRRAAWLSGLAVGALAHTVRRARTRQQFGRALNDNQSVAFTLARLMVRYEAVRALIATRAAAHDAAPGIARSGQDSALAAGVLAEAGELALAATRTAMQLHGAAGMTIGSPVERHYRTAPRAVAADLPAPELFARAAATLWPGSPS